MYLYPTKRLWWLQCCFVSVEQMSQVSKVLLFKVSESFFSETISVKQNQETEVCFCGLSAIFLNISRVF